MSYILFFLLIIAAIFFILHSDKQKKVREEESKRHEEELAEKQRREHIGWMEAIRDARLTTEVLRQAKLVGDQTTIDAVTDNRYDGPMPDEWDNGYFSSVFPDLIITNIAGINYRGNLKAYVGDFNGVLVPEPKNEYDPNAIMIKCEDGKHLGYIAENMTEDVRNLIGHPDAEGDTKWRHRITGHIDQREEDDYDDEYNNKTRTYFTGYVNIVKP